MGKPPLSGRRASDVFLDRIFKRFHEKPELPNPMTKTNHHRLAGFVERANIDSDIAEKLDALVAVAERARPRTD